MRIYCDIWSGQLRHAIDGPILGPLRFFQRDLLEIELVFVDNGTLVTTTVLGGGASFKFGIKSRPGNSQILVLSESYTLNGQVATFSVSLATAELAEYFSASIPPSQVSTQMFAEIEVSLDGTRQTFWQGPVIVNRELNMTTDTDPSIEETVISPNYVAFRGAITGRTGGGAANLDGLATTTQAVPAAVIIFVGAPRSGELWVIQNWVDEVEDGTYVVFPDDRDVLTNNKVWKRAL